MIKNSIILAFIFLLTQNCNKNKNPISYEESNGFQGIYALKAEEIGFWGQLFYSPYDSIHFTRVEGCDYLTDILVNKKNHLIIGASYDKLFFVDSRTHKRTKEVVVPETENPDPYFSIPQVRLFPCKWNLNLAFLCNWSVYLINLRTLSLERKLWDAKNGDKIIYTHDAVLSEDGSMLYLQLTLLGHWRIDEETSEYGQRQRLAKLDLINSKFYEIYDYPREYAPGSKFLFNSNKYVLSYDVNNCLILRFLLSTDALVDSFSVRESCFLWFPYSLGDSVLVQDLITGSFYMIHPENKYLELYMPYSFESHGDVTFATYQTAEGGEVYTCFQVRSIDKSYIVNLTKKEVVREFERGSIERMYLFF